MKIGDKIKIGKIDKDWQNYTFKLEPFVGKKGKVTDIGIKSDWFSFDKGDEFVFPMACGILVPWGKQDFFQTKIVVNPEQSKKLQKYLFSLGFEWLNARNSTVDRCINASNLYIYNDSNLNWSNNNCEYFENHNNKLIKFEDIIFDEKFEKEYLFKQALENKEFEPVVKNEVQKIKSKLEDIYNEHVGLKESTDKLMTFELDAEFTLKKIEVMTKNKSKYPRGNQYKDIPWIELFEAMERHLLECKKRLQQGNFDLTDEDGCSHLVKISTNAEMLDIQLRKI